MKKNISNTLNLTVLIVYLLFAAFFISMAGLEEVTPEICSASGGNSIKISNGIICYTMKGPENGEPVVMVHGFSTPGFVFEYHAASLAAAGFRVIVFDHFGRGSSGRPDARYDKDFFDTELLEFLDSLNIRKPVNLVGNSLGGGVVTVFASRHPERVKKLALTAPVGYRPPHTGLNAVLMIPAVGDMIMALFGRRSMIAAMKAETDKGIAPLKMLKPYIEQFNYRGTLQAFLATLRNYPLGNLDAEYKKVGKLGLPVLLLWGELDDFVPFDGNKKISAAIPGVKFVPVKGAGHALVYSHPAEVYRELVDFLK